MIFSMEDVKRLAAHESRAAISIYMPTHRGGPETQEDPIRFKNQLDQAEEMLRDHVSRVEGMSAKQRQQLLKPARDLAAEGGGFWRYQSDGLAILLSPEINRVYRLPVPFEPLTFVGRRFHLAPLLAAVEDGSDFYVLAMTQHNVRLLHGTRYSVSDIVLPGAPHGVDSMFFDKNTADQLQFHTIGGGGEGAGGGSKGEHAAVFHGQGGTERPQEERILHYMRKVNEEVTRALRGRKSPLIFAGDVTMFPLYQQANTYPHLLNEFVVGSPKPLSHKQLYDKAWPIVRERLEEERRKTVQRIDAAVRTHKGETNVPGIIQQCAAGRCDTLLLSSRAHFWGRYNGDGKVQPLGERKADAEDLLNIAALETLRHGGRVAVLENEEMPQQAVAAASFRF